MKQPYNTTIYNTALYMRLSRDDELQGESGSINWNEVTNQTVNNVFKKFRVTLTKSDAETGLPQGDATLAGAIYGLYKGDTLIDSYTTDANGQLTTNYYVCDDDWSLREINPSEGYLLDGGSYHVGAEPELYTIELNTTGNDLINDTLDLSRLESGKAVTEPEAVMSDDLIPAVVNALKPSAELKGVDLVENLTDYQNQPVWVDKLKVNKIALNLLSNAIKFTPAGGTVTVTPYCTSSCSDQANCGFIIEDTGMGMSEEFMERMYEPFTQEKRSEPVQTPGTGLGFSIVKRYVDLLGGTIRVESRLHEGTRWDVTLPVTKLKDGLNEKPKADSSDVLDGRRILLCEDNQTNAEIATMLLKDKGALVETAENGAIGLNKFASSPEGYYDIVLMDIRMPEMDGLEAARHIRALPRQDAKTVPIIAMTADAFEESILAAKNASMNDYITKPVEPGKMFETLQRYVKKDG